MHCHRFQMNSLSFLIRFPPRGKLGRKLGKTKEASQATNPPMFQEANRCKVAFDLSWFLGFFFFFSSGPSESGSSFSANFRLNLKSGGWMALNCLWTDEPLANAADRPFAEKEKSPENDDLLRSFSMEGVTVYTAVKTQSESRSWRFMEASRKWFWLGDVHPLCVNNRDGG